MSRPLPRKVPLKPGARSVALPQAVQLGAARLARRRRVRALVMVGVYALMIAHILQWRLTGRTLSPVVLSESMRTLETGALNAGFALFALALLVSLIAGRFLCGWACHMAALQDLCAWLLRRCGVRPHLFRSRLLALVPFVLAGTMFVWPTLRREVVAPALADAWPSAPASLAPIAPFPGWSDGLFTEDLWEGLPGAMVAVPFLLICGFGTVYFLGARGLCRYACPYAGLLAPAQKLAPVRVTVDPTRCDECGRCTAACGAGVRVLDELRARGAVTSRHCVRSLDCVAVCPSGALSLRGGRASRWPDPGRSRPLRYDLGWGEEFAGAGVFVLVFVGARGLYGVIPMLMAVSIAACATFILWKSWRLVRDRDARLGGAQLRRAGRIRAPGWALLGLGALVTLATGHSWLVRYHAWRADALDAQVTTPLDVVLAGGPVDPEARALAARALGHYRAASGWRGSNSSTRT